MNGKPEYVRSSCDASLRRLGVDHIDLYYQHRVDPNTPIEETVGAMADWYGRERFVTSGCPRQAPETLRRAVQGPSDRGAADRVFAVDVAILRRKSSTPVRELGIGFVAYSPLGRGFLTGQIKRFEDLPPDDFRRHSPRFQGENFQKNLDLVKRVEEIAKREGLHAVAVGPGVGAGPGQGHRSDPGHQTTQLPGGQRRCAGCAPDRRRPAPHR